MSISLPEKYKIVQLYCGQGTTALVTSDVVSLKNAQMCWIVVNFDCTASSNPATIVYQDVSVAGAAGVGLVNTVPIWSNLNTAATDTLVRRTDALNYTPGASAYYKQVIFEIDPASLTAGYDCIYVTVGALAATEALSVEAFLETRYPQATPPAAITD